MKFDLTSQRVYYTAFAVGLLYFVCNLLLINIGHFHEDAYILFIYVENFIQGNGITFYPGGPPTEGATDFLWFLMLSGLAYLGLDVGIAAILLNAIGVIIISRIIANEINNSGIKNRKVFWLLWPFTFYWMIQTQLPAALGGFSVFLYMALVLLALVMIHQKKQVQFIPYLCLTLALFRPDGVILGFGFALLGFLMVRKSKIQKLFLINLVVSVLLGMLYFFWRFQYFGNLLPLPLYVKSHGGDILEGLTKNYKWILNSLQMLVPLIVLAKINGGFRKYAMLFVPVVLLFVVLLTAHQSQNVGYRFQGPLSIVCYFLMLLALIEFIQKGKYQQNHSAILLLISLVFMGYSVKYLNKTKRHFYTFNYINQAPALLNSVIPQKSTIALTEAGRMAYWNQAGNHRIIDLVGLNSEHPAKNVIDVDYLHKISPDVLMYHQAKQLKMDDFKKKNDFVISLNDKDKQNIKNKIQYSQAELESEFKTNIAARVSTNFLREYGSSYDIFLVDYYEENTYQHVYAFKKELNIHDEVEAILNQSFDRENKMSYFEMKHKYKKSEDSSI